MFIFPALLSHLHNHGLPIRGEKYLSDLPCVPYSNEALLFPP